MNSSSAGRLIIISGPSGAGKSTVVSQLLEQCPLPLQISVSATTRAPRAGEIDGQDYYFLTPERFAELREAGDFLECKEVFGLGCWYGTLREPVATGVNAGNWVILEIDVEGALEVMESDLNPITLFIHPGDMEELERRLRARNTESDAQIAARLATATTEFQSITRYQYPIINDQVDRAVDEICSILLQYRDC